MKPGAQLHSHRACVTEWRGSTSHFLLSTLQPVHSMERGWSVENETWGEPCGSASKLLAEEGGLCWGLGISDSWWGWQEQGRTWYSMSSSEPRANYSPGAPSASLSQGKDTRLSLHLVSYYGLRDASLLPFSTISQRGKLETLRTVFPSYLSSQIMPVILSPTHPPFWPEAGLVLIVRDLFSTCPPALFFLRLSSHLQDIGFDTVHQPGHRIWSLAFCWEAEMLTADRRGGMSVQGQRNASPAPFLLPPSRTFSVAHLFVS